jgi:hypothetical protein
VRLLEKAMRLEPPEKSADTAPPKSVDELRQTLRARGLPDHIYAQTDFKKR